MKKKFKGLFVIETFFQLQIVNHLRLSKKFRDFEMLYVYNGFASFDSKKYFFDFYTLKGILRSIYFGYRLKSFYFETIVGNFSTNFTSIFLFGVLNYSNVKTIDDGIGTYVLMRYPRFYSEKFQHKLKNLCIYVICHIFKFPKRYRKLNPFEVTQMHFTPFSHFPGEFNINKIKLLKKCSLNDSVVFLGTPILNLDRLDIYKNIITTVAKSYSNVFYYPHSMEKLNQSLFNYNHTTLNVITFNSDFLDFCYSFGVPSVVIGSKSTALLIVSHLNPSSLRYYYDLQDSLGSSQTNVLYEEILQLHGVEPLI